MTFDELKQLPAGSIVLLHIKGGEQEKSYTAQVAEPKLIPRIPTTAVCVEVRACPNLLGQALIETAPGGALFIHRADSTPAMGFSARVRVEKP